MIPYGRQNIDEDDIQAVVRALRSPMLTQGPEVGFFEQEFAQAVHAKHAVACSNGTAALHLACLALGLGKGDWLWTSPLSFLASANCGLYCGASIDFVDIDPGSLNMSPTRLREKLELAAKHKRLPKVVVVVHFAGLPCDLEEISKLSKQYGFRLIEDAAHAAGAKYKDSNIGDGRYSDLAIFSTHPVKHITTGEGGLVTTNSDELRAKLDLFRCHGMTRDPAMMVGETDGPWYYQMVEVGYNYRITDLQSALGRSQLKKLPGFVAERRHIASLYNQRFDEVDGIWYQPEPVQSRSAYHLYVVQLPVGSDRKKIFLEMKEKGIGVNVHYIPIHLQPVYQQMGFKSGDFSAAEDYYKRCLTLPIFPGLTMSQVDYVVTTLESALKNEQ